MGKKRAVATRVKFIYEPKSEVNKVRAREDVNDEIQHSRHVGALWEVSQKPI
jgi:hypothetical protein